MNGGVSGTFAYDGAGDITKIGSGWYLYDGLRRLKEGTASQGAKEQTYAYDGFGNVTSVTTVGVGTQTIGVSATTNRLSGSSYDASGNQLSWGSGGEAFSYAYYPTDQIREITGGSPYAARIYGYTADGKRIGAYASADPEAGVTYTIRDLEGHVLRRYLESNGVWTWKEDYIWGPSGLLATASPTDGTRHYTLDHLGSPRLVTDGYWGYQVARHDYYPYMHARYYAFNIGRFMTVDPVRGKVGSSQSWNRYTYVRDNPINRFDPFGMADQDKKPCKKGQPCAEGVTAGQAPSAEPDDDDKPQEHELRQAIERTIALSLSVAPSGDAPHAALAAPVKGAIQQQTHAWDGHQRAKDAVTALTFAKFMVQSIREIQASTAVIQEKLAIQAHIAAGGGVSEEVATGFLESGFSTGPAGILVGFSFYGGWQVAGVIRRDVFPQEWNQRIGDAELNAVNGFLKGPRVIPPSWTVVGRP